jgi:hypothetical protein
MIFKEKKENENDRGDHANGDDLPVEIRFCAFLHRSGNLAHPLVAGGLAQDGSDEKKGENETRYRAQNRKRDAGIEHR